MVYRPPEEWRALIDEQAKGGKSAAAFCRERGLCSEHFCRRRQ